MARANVKIKREVRDRVPNDWNLCFQWVEYIYDDSTPSQLGYRFIWRRPDDSLQAAMGQARIPSGSDLFRLIHKAIEAGWFINVENEC